MFLPTVTADPQPSGSSAHSVFPAPHRNVCFCCTFYLPAFLIPLSAAAVSAKTVKHTCPAREQTLPMNISSLGPSEEGTGNSSSAIVRPDVLWKAGSLTQVLINNPTMEKWKLQQEWSELTYFKDLQTPELSRSIWSLDWRAGSHFPEVTALWHLSVLWWDSSLLSSESLVSQPQQWEQLKWSTKVLFWNTFAFSH